MGGSSYDRDVFSDSSSSGWGSSSSFGASTYSQYQFTSKTLDSSINPTGKIIKSTTKTPIIVVLDVTGSNVDFARIVYDKLPMFYGQIEQKGYLKDFDISFCAVGDEYTDEFALQVCDFAKGIELDDWIKKLVLEGAGGGQQCETYELAAYYLLKNTEFIPGSEPIIFFIGDEKPYEKLYKYHAQQYGMECDEDINSSVVFESLRKKVNDNVFMLLNKYCRRSFYDDITNAWKKILAPEHVIMISEEKAIVDLMLGIISMVSNSRTLDTYKVDMLDRGQTKERIEGVTSSLKKLSGSILPVKVEGTITKTTSVNKSKEKGKRI